MLLSFLADMLLFFFLYLYESTPVVTVDDKMRKEIEEQAVIYHKTANRPLNDFEIRVNDAAIELAVGDPSLLRKGNRGELLDKARKKVADDGYCFKKGKS